MQPSIVEKIWENYVFSSLYIYCWLRSLDVTIAPGKPQKTQIEVHIIEFRGKEDRNIFSNYFVQIVCYHHVPYTFQSESTLHSCLNVIELLARNRCDIWILSDSNEIRIQNHLWVWILFLSFVLSSTVVLNKIKYSWN